MYYLNYFRISIILCYVICVNSELKFNNLQEKLVLQLMKVKPKTNVVASSLLVRFPLCKLASVATGDAKEELLTVLGYKNDQMLEKCFHTLVPMLKAMFEVDLTFISKIYVNYTDDINPAFMGNASKFGVQVEKVGFIYPKAAVAYINSRIGAYTFKRLTDMVSANDINKNTSMIILSGGHFKGTWEFPFDFHLTKLTKFYHINNTFTVIPMMNKVESFFFHDAGDYQFLSIHFGSMGEGITFIVPNTAQGLPGLLNKIEEDPMFITNNVKLMVSTHLSVFIPRFKIRTYVDWTGFLQELGLYQIFDEEDSGLDAILKPNSHTKRIWVNKVKQKLFVQVDEMGVARFNRVPEQMRQVPQMYSVRQFVANVPFFFQVTLSTHYDRMELFSGVYYGPGPDDNIKT